MVVWVAAVGVVINTGTALLFMRGLHAGIEPEEVRAYLRSLPGAEGVHDLHLWAMSTTETALTVHLVKPDATIDDALLGRICRDLHDRFGVEHTTVPFERGDAENPCGLAPDEVV